MKKMYMKHNLKNCCSKILRKTSIKLHEWKEGALVMPLKTLGERNIFLNFLRIVTVIVISTAMLTETRFNISDEYTRFLIRSKDQDPLLKVASRTLTNIYDGAFSAKIVVNNFRKKAPSLLLERLLNTPLSFSEFYH